MKHFSIAVTMSFLLLDVCSQKSQSKLKATRIRRDEDSEVPATPAVSVFAAPIPDQKPIIQGQAFRSDGGSVYALPAGSEIIVGLIKTTFSCSGRIYGYYADVDNNCQIFHVCLPNESLETGQDKTVQYSFFCGNQTIFDQETLVCNYANDAFPCNEAENLYDKVNRNFGVTDRSSS